MLEVLASTELDDHPWNAFSFRVVENDRGIFGKLANPTVLQERERQPGLQIGANRLVRLMCVLARQIDQAILGLKRDGEQLLKEFTGLFRFAEV
jgi:hypothetical protein